MEKGLISIIVPVYNVVEYLDDCVGSLCNQEYRNVEIILVDDGSTDGCSEKCDAWKDEDKRIIVIHKENGGISSARNVGLEIARGEYISFIDSDDMVEKNIYSRLLATMEEKKCDIACCSYKCIKSDGSRMLRNYESVAEGYLSKEQYLTEFFQNARKHGELVVVWNKLYRREVIDSVRFVLGVIHEDDYFLNDILFRMNSFYFIQEGLYLYRIRDNSIMHSSFSERRLDYYHALQQRIDLCLANDIAKDSIVLLVENLIEAGIRFWLMLEYLHLLDKKGRLLFYNEVVSDIMKYSEYLEKKNNILRWIFVHNPVLLKSVYRIYKCITKKRRKRK